MDEEHLDREAVARCRGGDLDAFGDLVERYERPVFNTILHMVGHADDAREICQQVFTKAFEHLASYDRERRFFSWIYRIAVNESINHLHARRLYVPLGEHLAERLPNPAEAFAELERSSHLHEAILELAENYRAVVILHHFMHLSYSEIADVLHVAEKTVKSRLFSARQLLRTALEARGHARA